MLAASALILGSFASAPAGASGSSGTRAAAETPTVDLAGSVTYTCAATAAGLPLGDYLVDVRLTSTVAALAPQGAEIPETAVGIQLTMPEGLRGATAALGATEAGGRSDDASVTVQVGGAAPASVPLLNVRAPRAAIPQKFGQPWVIQSSGTTAPGATIPADATGQLRLSAPDAFSVNATLFRPSGPGVKTSLDCATKAGAKQKLQAIIPITTPAPPSPTPVRTKGPIAFGCQFAVGGQAQPAIGTGVIWGYAALPTAALAGSTYPSIGQGYVLAFPDAVRNAFYSNYGFRKIQAVGGGTSMGIVTGAEGETVTPVPLTGIASAPTDIADATGPLVVQTLPTLASWTVPSEDFTLRMGAAFQASLQFTDAQGGTQTGSIACQDVGNDATARDLIAPERYTEQVKTSTSVSASNAKATYGQTADVNVTVSPQVSSGTVSITTQGRKLASGDAAPLAVARVQGGEATLTLPAKSLKPGRYVLNVIYGGNGTHKSALGRTIVRIAPLASSVSVASVTPDPIIATRTRAVVRAEVTSDAEANGETTTGIVRVLSGGIEYGRGRVTDGVANVRLDTFAKPGERNLRVVYVGNSVVGQSATTTSITVSPKN